MTNIYTTSLALMMPLVLMAQSTTLERPQGKMAYTLHDQGDTLIVAIPGIGDNQGQYRFMVPKLVAAGYQVATVDLRGHGDSSREWPEYSSAANGKDIVALIDELGAKNVILIGNSIGGATSVWVGAERPGVVKSIVMINPFVEDAEMKWYEKVLFKAAFARPWGKTSWLKFYKSNYPSQRPDDFNQHIQELDAMLSRPGGYKAFAATLWSSHAEAAKRIPDVTAPVKVIIGSKDPDYKDPVTELAKLKRIFNADATMIDGAGHYPHVEFANQTNEIILKYLERKN